MSTDYDSLEAIIHASASLKSFYALLDMRTDASYMRREILHEFYAHGFWLDSTGNICAPLTSDGQRILPGTSHPAIDSVMTATEFRKHFGQESFRITMPASIPFPGIACAMCTRTWGVEDAHNCATTDLPETETITDFAGKSLGEFKTHLAGRTTALYSLQNDMPAVRRQNTAPGNLDADFILLQDDEVHINVRRFYHLECKRGKLAAETEREIRMLLNLAGYRAIRLRPAPNRYGPESYYGPWFRVTTEKGHVLVIGWRRRVIAIDWSATGRNLLHLFDDVRDTKGKHYIHAWLYEQAVDYLKRIRQALEVTDSPG